MLYESILERTNLQKWRTDWRLLGAKKGEWREASRCSYKSNMGASCGDGNVLYLGSINVNILIVALSYSFMRCNWVGSKRELSVLFLTTTQHSIIISKK